MPGASWLHVSQSMQVESTKKSPGTFSGKRCCRLAIFVLSTLYLVLCDFVISKEPGTKYQEQSTKAKDAGYRSNSLMSRCRYERLIPSFRAAATLLPSDCNALKIMRRFTASTAPSNVLSSPGVVPGKTRNIFSGTNSSPSVVVLLNTTSRSIKFSSSRTLPGQL